MKQQFGKFSAAIAAAKVNHSVWEALRDLSQTVAGHRLFTVTTVDMEAGLARRAFTSHPVEYPLSGTKPIHRDRWFDIVHGEQRSFIANTIGEIAQVFPDHDLIRSLGCGSVINLPVVLKGELTATINILHEELYYTPERVALAEEHRMVPAMLCCALAYRFDLPDKKPD